METVVRAPPERVFDVSLDIDVHQASMRGSGERAVAGVTGGMIGLDELVTWRARHFGITWTMTSRITELERPRRFVDEQVRGPFARYRHEHEFVPCPEGTRMLDRVAFTAPLGPLGRLVDRVVLDRHLQGLIAARNAFVTATCERPP